MSSPLSSPPPSSSQALLDEAEYMEDLEVKSDLRATTTTTTATPSSSQTSTTSTTTLKTASTTKGGKSASSSSNAGASGSKKRQMNLTDLFTVTPGAAKRQRTRTLSTSSASSSGSSPGIPRAPPRLVNGVRPLNSIPLNIESYKATLSEESARLLGLECETMGRTWLKVLVDEIKKPYFLELKKFLWQEGVRDAGTMSIGSPKIFPPPSDIYNWTRVTPLGRVKVVILGQDPYHGPGQAHGLCFSVKKGVTPPPSLVNIYKEIKNDYEDFVIPKHGDLTTWAENGVLLINTCLTVRSGKAGSHNNKGWEQFMDSVVSLVDQYGGATLSKTTGGVGKGVVFLAWGAWAGKRVAKLSKTKHLILTSAHPSPLSAYKTPGFFGNQHFKKANDWLENKYGADAKVEWTKLE